MRPIIDRFVLKFSCAFQTISVSLGAGSSIFSLSFPSPSPDMLQMMSADTCTGNVSGVPTYPLTFSLTFEAKYEDRIRKVCMDAS